jgi:hypothetical protein
MSTCTRKTSSCWKKNSQHSSNKAMSLSGLAFAYRESDA